MGHTQNKKHFFAEITKADHKLSKMFHFIKISHVFTELCFSICVMFFAKKGHFQP